MSGSGNSKIVFGILGILIVIFIGSAAVYFVFFVALPQWTAQQQQQKLAAQWDEFHKAVVLAGTPLTTEVQEAPRDYDSEASRLLALHNNRSVNFEDPELAKAWASIEAESDHGIVLLQRIGSIDRDKPSGYQLLADALRNDGDAQTENDGLQRGADELSILDLEQQFRAVESQLDTSIGTLQGIASNLSREEIPNQISVHYFPSWDGTYRGDTILLQNISANAIEKAEVVVTTHMKDGTSKVHLHYVDQWPADSTVRTEYAYGATTFANSQAGPTPDTIDAVVYTPTGTSKSSYALTPEEFGTILKRYCSGLTFSGDFLQEYADASGSYPAGFQFQFRGLPTLPVKSVEVRFTADADNSVRDYIWQPSEKLVAGTDIPIRAVELSGPTPDHVDFILRFAGTDFAEAVHRY